MHPGWRASLFTLTFMFKAFQFYFILFLVWFVQCQVYILHEFSLIKRAFIIQSLRRSLEIVAVKQLSRSLRPERFLLPQLFLCLYVYQP